MARRAAYVTLLTATSYLPGVLVLDCTLRSVESAFPLIVMVTPTLPQDVRSVLERRGISIRPVESLRPPEGKHSLSTHDARFADTWTKLRAFELKEYERVVLMDADMIVMRNMDELFDIDLPNNWIAAAHVCACNPRKLPHYPADWVPENCAYTPLIHPSGLTTPVLITEASPRPHTQLNSGIVVLNPSLALAETVRNHLYTSPLVPTWSFPDQDLLSDLFRGKWKPLPWCYNALKTLMLIHKPLWRDEEIRCLHYILADKPWQTRVSEDDTGEYAKSHRWWWQRLDQLGQEMKGEPEDWKLVLANVAQ
ncbi:glycosyltransferase family 8 protein [Suillus plorans]|uniref:Glycosyltransferase family 8 protein n=1 Tax=Suillus plorans TaxID=116603 RepID=A0A9P7J3U3_9AGAM|nr:glycosyltransferase family 8 protein [Suillus plorans]KAG1801499.1 glycosyltransferase family 8 protein [Suillus plorans]